MSLTKIIISISTVLFVGAGILLAMPDTALAAGPVDVCDLPNSSDSSLCQDSKDPNKTAESTVNSVINMLLYIVGAGSVIAIIYGGFRYVTSRGDSQAVTSAKNTIQFAVVGLVVALIAFMVVNWVFKNLTINSVSDADNQADCVTVGGDWQGGSCVERPPANPPKKSSNP